MSTAPTIVDGFCTTHRPKNRELWYAAHAAWMDRQWGRQRQCPSCHRWLFRCEFGPGWRKALRNEEPLHDTPHGHQTAEESAEEQR